MCAKPPKPRGFGDDVGRPIGATLAALMLMANVSCLPSRSGESGVTPDQTIATTSITPESGSAPPYSERGLGATVPRESVTAGGRIFVAWDEGDRLPPTVQGREMSIPTLSGAVVEVSVPTGIELSVGEDLGGRISLVTDHGEVEWRRTRRGWGYMGVTSGAGTKATLVDLVEMGDALLAQYDLYQPIDITGPKHVTLWQGVTADMISFDYDSLDAALADVGSFHLDEKPGYVVFGAADLPIAGESVGMGIVPVPREHHCRQTASLIVSPSMRTSELSSSVVKGRWGEFQAFESGFDWGFVFQSTSAVATVEANDCRGPAPAPFLAELQDELLEHLRIEWEDTSVRTR